MRWILMVGAVLSAGCAGLRARPADGRCRDAVLDMARAAEAEVTCPLPEHRAEVFERPQGLLIICRCAVGPGTQSIRRVAQ